jgi:hypothetical protein
MGDMARVDGVFGEMMKQPGFLIELQYTNWKNALGKIYPDCAIYVRAQRPKYRENGDAIVEFSIGPPDSVHGGEIGRCLLTKKGEAWVVRSYSTGFPGYISLDPIDSDKP